MSDQLTYYAKVEQDVVTSVHVVTWDFLISHPERYGDPKDWLEVFPDESGRGYCSVGWIYDPVQDKFLQPVYPDFSNGS